MDEATSALDAETENLVTQTIEELGSDVTTITDRAPAGDRPARRYGHLPRPRPLAGAGDVRRSPTCRAPFRSPGGPAGPLSCVRSRRCGYRGSCGGSRWGRTVRGRLVANLPRHCATSFLETRRTFRSALSGVDQQTTTRPSPQGRPGSQRGRGAGVSSRPMFGRA